MVWAQSFGYADARSGAPATPDTTYRIASLTKTFTGTMVMQLSDQGRLDVSDPLTRFIPSFSIKPPLGFGAGGPITIRSILMHHSGIPGDIDISTIHDMAKFIKMVHAGGMGERGRVLKPETLEIMLTPQNGGIPLDFDNRIGLIWFLDDADLSYAGRIC